MNLGFADALRRQLEPAWPRGAEISNWPWASPAFATLLSTKAVDRVVQSTKLLLLLLGLLLLRGLCLLGFLRHAALQAVK
jgi:hypothetical protein